MSQDVTFPAVSVLDFTDAEAAFKFFADQGAEIADNEADGIRTLPIVEKIALIDVPFLAVNWRFNEGTNGTFVSVEFMTRDGMTGVFNDGSTGVMAQLSQITETRTEKGHPYPTAGRLVSHGLRVSRYTFLNEKGKEQNAETYYLAF